MNNTSSHARTQTHARRKQRLSGSAPYRAPPPSAPRQHGSDDHSFKAQAHRFSSRGVQPFHRRATSSSSSSSSSSSASRAGHPNAGRAQPKETNVRRLAQRQKQIDFGKNTLAYDRYSKSVPKRQRVKAKQYDEHPVTPEIHVVTSKRSFDGQVKKWRRLLHLWDPPSEADKHLDAQLSQLSKQTPNETNNSHHSSEPVPRARMAEVKTADTTISAVETASEHIPESFEADDESESDDMASILAAAGELSDGELTLDAELISNVLQEPSFPEFETATAPSPVNGLEVYDPSEDAQGSQY